MMRLRSLLLWVPFALGACSGVTAPDDADPAGCYDLTLGSWNGEAEEVLPLPPSIALRSEVGSDVFEKDRRLIRPNPHTDDRSYRWAWWDTIAGDSIRLLWSTGFTGIEMRLGREGTGFAGFARNFLDYPGGTAEASAALRRTGCR